MRNIIGSATPRREMPVEITVGVARIASESGESGGLTVPAETVPVTGGRPGLCRPRTSTAS